MQKAPTKFPNPVIVSKAGVDLMHAPLYNKGTAYPYAERLVKDLLLLL